MKNKKIKIAIIITLIITILAIGLIPKKAVYKDGGTVTYTALFYKVTDYRSLTQQGLTIEIFGFEVYNKIQCFDIIV